MMTFTPASDVWTLGYDELDDICWRHNKTEELHYVPPGQPLTLPPRSLANGFHPNLPDSPPLTPAATARAEAFPLRVYDETVHVNSVPKTAMAWLSFCVGSTQPRVYPPNQWLPPWNFPSDTSAVTAHVDASPKQGDGEGVPFNNNSALKIPEAARIGPTSSADETSCLPPPVSTVKDAKHGLPPKRLENAPRSTIPNDPFITPAATMRPEDSLFREGVSGEKRRNDSILEVPTAARVKPLSTVEDPKPRRCSSMSRTEDAKHELTRKIVVNPPHTNIAPKPIETPTDNDCTKASRIQSGDEREESHNDSALEVPEAGRVRPDSSVEDTKSHLCSAMSSKEDVSHRLTGKRLENAPRSILPHEQTSRVRGDDERKKFDNDPVLEVTVAGTVRPVYTVKDTKPWVDDAKHELPPKSVTNTCQPSLSNQPHLNQTNKDDTKASVLRVAEEGEEYDNDSSLKVPEAARVRTASTVEDTKSHLRSLMSWEDDVKHESTQKSFENGPRPGGSRETDNDPGNKNLAKASRIRGGGEGEQFDDDSTLEVPEATRYPPAYTVKDTKPMSRVDDTKHGLTTRVFANTPRLNTRHEPQLTLENKDSAMTYQVRGCGDEEELDHDSSLDVHVAVRVKSASTPLPPVENAEHGLPRKSVQSTSLPNIPRNPPSNPAAKLSANTPLLSGGDGEKRFNNNSALEATETVRVQQAFCEGNKLRPSHPLLRAEEAKQWSREGATVGEKSTTSTSSPEKRNTRSQTASRNTHAAHNGQVRYHI